MQIAFWAADFDKQQIHSDFHTFCVFSLRPQSLRYWQSDEVIVEVIGYSNYDMYALINDGRGFEQLGSGTHNPTVCAGEYYSLSKIVLSYCVLLCVYSIFLVHVVASL